MAPKKKVAKKEATEPANGKTSPAKTSNATKRKRKQPEEAPKETEETAEQQVEEKEVGKSKAKKAKKDGANKTEKAKQKTKQEKGESSEPNVVKNKSATDFESLSFACEQKTTDGRDWNLKIACWNISGKDGMKYFDYEKPDIMCVQEIKISEDKLDSSIRNVPGYTSYWCLGSTDGYAGVGIYTKVKPLSVTKGIGDEAHDKEGRVITAEYEKFYLVNAYVPNAGRGLVRLEERMKWDPLFRKYLKTLDEKKPVIICGDMNVSHLDIDLANPKTNKRNAGFTQEERDGFTALLAEGFADTYRHLYEDKTGVYTFWTYMANARSRNIGWRLDYFLMSRRLLPALCDHVVRSDVFGSDHCPIVLLLHM